METPRCRLRHVCPDDVPHVFSATRFAGFNDGMLWDAPQQIEDLMIPHEKSVDAWREGRFYTFTIEDRLSGAFIGRVVLAPVGDDGLWRLGFWVHPLRQGNGYATEAARAAVGLVFSRLKAAAIVACHAVWNTPSKRVL